MATIVRHTPKEVFGQEDPKHPGVAHVFALGDVLPGGSVTVLGEVETPFAGYRLTPRDKTRTLFTVQGWRTVVGFQTRNVPHLGHEYVQKTALTFVDGIFLNPVIGRKKAGDFRDEVILGTYEALVDHYYPKNARCWPPCTPRCGMRDRGKPSSMPSCGRILAVFTSSSAGTMLVSASISPPMRPRRFLRSSLTSASDAAVLHSLFLLSAVR